MNTILIGQVEVIDLIDLIQPYGPESTLREMTDRDRRMRLAGPVARIAGDDEIRY